MANTSRPIFRADVAIASLALMNVSPVHTSQSFCWNGKAASCSCTQYVRSFKSHPAQPQIFSCNSRFLGSVWSCVQRCSSVSKRFMESIDFVIGKSGDMYSILCCIQHSQQPRWNFAIHSFSEVTKMSRSISIKYLSSIFSKNDFAQGKHTRDLLEHRGKYLKIA